MTAARRLNPYIAGSPVTGAEMFFGRADVFEFVGRHLVGRHRDSPIVLYGQRRTGKTSILYQLQRHLYPAYQCVVIDLHGMQFGNAGALLHSIATAVSRALAQQVPCAVPVPGLAAFTARPLPTFEDKFLDDVWAALGDDHLILLLDEAARLSQEVAAGHLDRRIFEYLRHLMQSYERLTFIFSISDGLEEMQKDYAFLFSSSLYHRISFLDPPTARELITSPVDGLYQVTPEAVARILAVTSCHPYYTQLICHSLFDLWSRTGKPALTVGDVDSVLPEVIELGSPNLTYVWAESTRGERAVMAAMTRLARSGADPVPLARIRKAWRQTGVGVPEPEATQAIRGLRGREVVIGDDAYSFTVDLQRLWIAEHQRLEWTRHEFAGPARGRGTGPGTDAGGRPGSTPLTWRRPRTRDIAIGAGTLLGAGLAVALVVTLAPGGSPPGGSVSCGSPNGPGSPVADVFWKGANGDLWEAHGPATGELSEPVDLSTSDPGIGSLGSDPAVGADAAGDIYVYWEGSTGNHDLWEAYRDGKTWSGPYDLRMPLSSAPSVAVTPDGMAYVFWEGQDGNLHEAYGRARGGLSGPSNLGMGSLGSEPAAATDGKGDIYVYYQGAASQHIWEAYFDGPTQVGPNKEIEAETVPGGAPSVAVTPDGIAYVFWEGQDGNLYEAYGPAKGQLSVLPADCGMGALRSGPAAATDGKGDIYVYYQEAASQHLWEAYWDGSTPVRNKQNATNGGGAPAVAIYG